MKQSSARSSRSSTLSPTFSAFYWKVLFGILLGWWVFRFGVHTTWQIELVVKYVLFGSAAVWLARNIKTADLFDVSAKRFWPGMYSGLFMGGFYLLTAVAISYVRGRPYMLTGQDIGLSALLVLFTAWIESLFFCGFLYKGLQKIGKGWTALSIPVAVAVYVLFNIPGVVQQYAQAPVLLLSLGLFAVGQFTLFRITRSLYAVTLSHFLWGMFVLLYS